MKNFWGKTSLWDLSKLSVYANHFYLRIAGTFSGVCKHRCDRGCFQTVDLYCLFPRASCVSARDVDCLISVAAFVVYKKKKKNFKRKISFMSFEKYHPIIWVHVPTNSQQALSQRNTQMKCTYEKTAAFWNLRIELYTFLTASWITAHI